MVPAPRALSLGLSHTTKGKEGHDAKRPLQNDIKCQMCAQRQVLLHGALHTLPWAQLS